MDDLDAVLVAAREGKLSGKSDDELRAMLKTCAKNHGNMSDRYGSSQIAFAIAAIQGALAANELARQHREAISEQQRLHDAQIQAAERLQGKTSEEGKARHKQTQRVAWYAVWIAFAGLVLTALSYLRPVAIPVSKTTPAEPHPTNTSMPVSLPTLSTGVVLTNFLSNTSSPPQEPKK